MTAPLVTIAAVGVGVATTTGVAPAGVTLAEKTAQKTLGSASAGLADRGSARISRDFNRSAVVGASNVRAPKVTGHRWATADLDLRATPQENALVLGEIEALKKVAITGRRHEGYAQVLVNKKARWVTAAYLTDEKPSTLMGLSMTPCPDGSSIEAGLQDAAVRVYRAACAAFPELSSYGGQDGHGEHVNGQAIDFMTPSHETGERLKDFLFAHRYELGLFDIIWARTIWTIERDGEGFRGMSDRGSATANHFDHVHIKVL